MPTSIKVAVPSKNTRCYNTKIEVLDTTMLMVVRNDEPSPSELGDLLCGLPGVSYLVMFPYQVQITKADRWDWGDIEPKVLEVLEGLEMVANE